MSSGPSLSESVIETRLRPTWPLDLIRTLAPLRHGLGDSTVRFEPGTVWRATRTPQGPATLRLATHGAELSVLAWGAGAGWAIEALPRLLGAEDDRTGFVPSHAIVRELDRRMAGLRFGRTDALFESLLPAIIEQKVTGSEARAAYRALVRTFGEWAPGPGGLRLAPLPEVLARLPYWAFHPLGLEQRRTDVIRRSAARAAWLEAGSMLSWPEARARLRTIPGVGPWTEAEVARTALGDPDAVSVGDYHMPSMVAWALAGEARADDARMLELLNPYRGHRGRVVRLLEAAGIEAPRFGPRIAARSIGGI